MLSPDGTQIALESYNGAASWWDIRTGATTQFKEVVKEAAFSPDGTRIVSSSKDDVHPYRLWCARSGKPIGQPFGTRRWDDDLSSPSVSFSPDSKRIACGLGSRLKLFVVDAIIGAVICSLGIVSRDQFSFSPCSRYIALISEQQIQLRDVTGSCIRYLPLPHSYSSVRFAPDSECVLLVGPFRCLVWNTITGRYHLHPSEREKEGDMDKDNYSGSERDGGDELEDEEGREEEEEDDNSYCGNGQFWDESQDERRIWVVEWLPDGKIFRGDRLVDSELADLTGRPISSGTTFKVAFSHNAKFTVTLYISDLDSIYDRHMQIWDATTCVPIGEPRTYAYGGFETELIISRDSNRLICNLFSYCIDTFDMTTGAQLANYDYTDLIPRISPYPNVGSGAGVLYMATDGWMRDAFSNSILCWIPQRYRNMHASPLNRYYYDTDDVEVKYNGSVMVFQHPKWMLVIDLLDIARAFNVWRAPNAPLVEHPEASALIIPNRSDIIRPSTPQNPVHDDSPPICLTSAQLGGASHAFISDHLAIENTRGRKRSISQVE
jgi:WD40 repeat protein